MAQHHTMYTKQEICEIITMYIQSTHQPYRDPSPPYTEDPPIIKDPKHLDNWKWKTLALAGAQHVDEAFNENYQPHGANKLTLFTEKQRFVYAIFMTTLQTGTGWTRLGLEI